MQVLALYTMLAPHFRPGSTRHKFWTWTVSGAGLGTGIASLAVYPFFTVLSPLLAFVSSAMQAFVTLQLVLFLNDQRSNTPQAEAKKEV